MTQLMSSLKERYEKVYIFANVKPKLVRNLLFLFTLFILVSCSTTRVTNREIGGDDSPVIQKKLVGEIKVDLTKKVTGTALNTKGNVKAAKQMAIWNCLVFSGAHTLIDPVYKITTTGKSLVSVEVAGYHGSYDNVKVATKQDIIDYIRFNLLSGNGILNVSFEEFRAYYHSLIADEAFEEFDIMDDYELRMYFDNEVSMAKKSKSPLNTNNKKKNGNTGKVVGRVLLVWLAIGAITAPFLLLL